MDYKIGQRVLVRTQYKGERAGRPAVIKGISGSSWSPKYTLQIDTPAGEWEMESYRTNREIDGFLLDNPANRKKFPVPDWEQIDLEEMGLYRHLRPFCVTIYEDEFEGFASRIMEACGGIKYDRRKHGTAEGSERFSSFSSHKGEELIYIFPTKEQVDAVIELCGWLVWYKAENFKRGVTKGHKLLYELNEGEITGTGFERDVGNAQRNDHQNPFT